MITYKIYLYSDPNNPLQVYNKKDNRIVNNPRYLQVLGFIDKQGYPISIFDLPQEPNLKGTSIVLLTKRGEIKTLSSKVKEIREIVL